MKQMVLVDTDNNDSIIDIKLSKHFKPSFALTVNETQGMTINKPYTFYEHHKMTSDMLHLCSTSARQQNM